MPRVADKHGGRAGCRLVMAQPPTLPAQPNIDILALSNTLKNITTSYKFFWLLALLEILKQRNFRVAQPIQFSEIVFVILKLAKEPLCRFKLSFGAHDHLHQHLERLAQPADGSAKIGFWETDNASLGNATFRQACVELSYYVPHRWLRSFLVQETQGAGGATRNERVINQKIVQVAAKKFHGKNPPPYFIEPDKLGGYITVHPLWAEYFAENIEIIRGWCLWHFAKFLQARNPNIPTIINKITAAGEQSRRQALLKQRDFWSAIVAQTNGINCLYSGKHLSGTNFDLDHYVPWSFVGHDNIWNLIPVYSSVNSSKGDSLPDDRYFNDLIGAHHKALIVREQYFPRKWQNLIESYISDLKLPAADLTDRDKLCRAYHTFIPPLIDLAKANRFKAGWTYNPPEPLFTR